MTLRSAPAVLDLMRRSGQPLVISGVKVRKWRAVDARPHRRIQVGVTPTLEAEPSAYIGSVAGVRVPGRVVLALLRSRAIQPRRPWFVRTRATLNGELPTNPGERK